MNPYFKNDGWNEEEFENAGLMDILDDMAKLSYELKNCRRLTPFVVLVDQLQEMKDKIGEVIEILDEVDDVNGEGEGEGEKED
jgi:hypothetical protein